MLKITSLNTDASAKAIGAVLMQKDKDGRINPFKDPPAINPPPSTPKKADIPYHSNTKHYFNTRKLGRLTVNSEHTSTHNHLKKQ